MALITCPECSGTVSDRAYSCPHCGFPFQGKAMPSPRKSTRRRRPNGSGTIVKLPRKSGPIYQVRVNTRIDDRGYPQYDILGNFPDQVAADIALAEYNKDPFDPANRKKTFKETYKEWYVWKFKKNLDAKGKKCSSEYCYAAAFKHCSMLHNVMMHRITAADLQRILDKEDLSHATSEHIKSLFAQMWKYALQMDIVTKNIAEFTKVDKDEDDESGVPFTPEELQLLWEHKDVPFVDTILIYCYSGWRINELARMPIENIDIVNRTFTGGLKNRYSRNRTIPIHSKIFDMVVRRRDFGFSSLIYHDTIKSITEPKYREFFRIALTTCGISDKHTPHDCRHTFNVLLDSAGVDRVTRYKLMGHAGKDINERVYTSKSLKQLREAIEKI